MFDKLVTNNFMKNVSVKFYLDKPQLPLSFIMVGIGFNGFRVQLSTKIKVPPADFSKDNLINKNSQYAKFNTDLKALESEIERFYQLGNLNRKFIEKSEMKKFVEELITPQKKINQNDFIILFDRYVENHQLEPASKNKYRVVKKMLLELNEKTGKPILVNDFNDADFVETFIRKFNELKANGLINYGYMIKSVVGYGLKLGLIESERFKQLLTKPKSTQKKPLVIMNEAEVKRFFEVELNRKSLIIARDKFKIQMLTTLRVSDMHLLNRNNITTIDGKDFIIIKQKKTKNMLKIPLLPEVREILEKHDFDLPITQYTYNSYLEKICILAGIDEEVLAYSGKKQIVYKKYELIRSHTARRMGISQLLKKGLTLAEIMQISGHTTLQSLLKYLYSTQDEAFKKYLTAFSDGF